MRGAVRAVLTTAVAAVLVAVAGPATAAPADPVPTPTTQQPEVFGDGPDDLLFYYAYGFAPDLPVTVTLDGVSVTYEQLLATQVPTGSADRLPVSNSSNQRTPADLVPGTYTLTFAQPGADGGAGRSVTTPTFTIDTPTLQQFGRSLYPGEGPLTLQFQGLGDGPSVTRTLTIDGATVPSTPVSPSNSALFDPYQRFTVPTTLAPGGHTIALAQNVNPTVTVSKSFTVFAPSLTVSAASTTERGTITVSGTDFGVNDSIVVSVGDAGGDRYQLTTVSGGPSFSATVDLPGIESGTATVTAVSAHNQAMATAQLAVVPSELRSPQILKPGAQLQDPRGYATFRMQTDGNLVLYVLGQARWSSRTGGHPGAYLVAQDDGNLVVYSASGTALWAARTSYQDPPVRLYVQDDGNVVLYSQYGRAVWSTGTAGNPAGTLLAGQRLATNGRLTGPGKVVLTMQSDGNAVLYGQRGTVVWSTRTGGNPGAVLTLQTDGNLVVYSRTGAPLWANRVAAGTTRLVAQSDGNLVEYGPTGKALWASGTGGR